MVIKKTITLIIGLFLFLCLLYLGGTNFRQWSTDIELKDANTVFSPITNKINIQQNNSTNNDSPPLININSQNNKDILDKDDTFIQENKNNLITLEDIEKLISNIRVEDPIKGEYNRDTFEKPKIVYTTEDGKKLNRNKYSVSTSYYLISADPFSYNCPYTGLTITDSSKIDYDHIVALKSAYEHGAANWTDEQKNKFAYDLDVGVGVLNKANRGKGAKSPSEWLPDINKEDYCYSYFLISNKYNLSMSSADIQACKFEIISALNSGETVEKINKYKEK